MFPLQCLIIEMLLIFSYIRSSRKIIDIDRKHDTRTSQEEASTPTNLTYLVVPAVIGTCDIDNQTRNTTEPIAPHTLEIGFNRQ